MLALDDQHGLVRQKRKKVVGDIQVRKTRRRMEVRVVERLECGHANNANKESRVGEAESPHLLKQSS